MRDGPGRLDWKSGKDSIANRLRMIRVEIFGENGVTEVAERLGLPIRTWLNYEGGVAIPGEVMLGFLMLTGAEPSWLLTGSGAKYRLIMSRASPDAAGRVEPEV